MGRRIASYGLAAALCVAFVALIVALRTQPKRNRGYSQVTIGMNDQVYYSGSNTAEEARALGRALQAAGYLHNANTSVLLTKTSGRPVVSFVVNEGGWNEPDTITGIEELGRRAAGALGGFPIQIHLVDTEWHIQKSLVVGKVEVGTKDAVYYYGTATAEEAGALGQALRGAGYFANLGANVSLSKDEGTAIGFIVSEDAWTQPVRLAQFESLTRQVAPSVGGLPVELRLLSTEMETKKQVVVR